MSESNFLSKVFLWMFIGLLVTFGTGVLVSGNVQALEFIFSGGGYWFLVVAELVTVIVLSARLSKMSPTGAKIGFVFYSFLSGLTFSSIFIVYKVSSIIAIFLITSLIMLIFSVLGAKTKIDLSKFGSYLLMILVGIIIASIINIFVGSESFSLGICIVSLIVFILFISYDVQKVLRMYEMDPTNENLAIIGALELYLDFINIFLDLLRLFGDNN